MSEQLVNAGTKIMELLSSKSFTVGEPLIEDQMVQLPVALDEHSGTIRIYNAKGGIRIDLEKIEHMKTRLKIAVLLGQPSA